MKVSLIQMNSGSDKPANLAQARDLIQRAVAEETPDWIGLPEVWDFIGGARRDKLAAAEELPGGPAWSLMSELARTHRVFIHAGSILEKVPGEDRMHNTTVVFDRDGLEIARYRKIHMFDITTPDGVSYRESASFAAGDAIVTYDCEGVTVGCAICYDLRFPYLFGALAEKGAQMIALPSAFTLQTGKDHWEVLCRARAIETETYFRRRRTDRAAHAGQRNAHDLRPFASRRSLGPCRCESVGRAGHRVRAHRSRTGREGARADPGRAAPGEVVSLLRFPGRPKADPGSRSTSARWTPDRLRRPRTWPACWKDLR